MMASDLQSSTLADGPHDLYEEMDGIEHSLDLNAVQDTYEEMEYMGQAAGAGDGDDLDDTCKIMHGLYSPTSMMVQ